MIKQSNLKDKLEDDELDLSLMQMTDIPVKEIEKLGNKVLKLNISHNLLSSVPENFPFLTHLTALDLSKNSIFELPENFGQLVKLRTLDLYSNQIEKLPLSFAQLKSLKWLDLKENPLVPELAKAAGPCITKVDCEQAAKRVVARLQSIQSQLLQEERKRLETEDRIRRHKEKVEEAERERLRAEKKMAKERRREEARIKEMGSKEQIDSDKNHVQINRNGSNKTSLNAKNGHAYKSDYSNSTAGFSCFGFLLKLMLFLSFSVVAVGVTLLWFYTGGKMDAESIQLAVPIIQKDVESHVMTLGKRTEKLYIQTEKMARPYIKDTVKKVGDLSKEAQVKAQQGYDWVEANYGDIIRESSSKAKQWSSEAWVHIRAKCVEFYKNLLPTLARYWEKVEPYFIEVGQKVTAVVLDIHHAVQENFPVYMEWLKVTVENAYHTIYTYVKQLMA